VVSSTTQVQVRVVLDGVLVQVRVVCDGSVCQVCRVIVCRRAGPSANRVRFRTGG